MKKEILTIAGVPGSGKSSTADRLAHALGYNRFSSGDFMRRMAEERGVSLAELSTAAELDNGVIDQAIDEKVRGAGEGEKLVIDSRLAFHWIPNSFKVYLDLPLEISKDRIMTNLKENALRRQSENSYTAEEIYEKITARLESEKKRYRELYGVDYTDKASYDLVVDTNKNNLDEVVFVVLEKYREWLEN